MKRRLLLAAAVLLMSVPLAARAADTKVTFGTDWLAEAEHGGFYEALAMGLYKKHGLDVTIRMGGPGTNPMQQVAAGVVDFQLASGSFGVLSAVQHEVPVKAVAAFFQKDPQVLISHEGVGNDTLAELKGKPIMISAAARSGFWLFLKSKYGFSDDQIRPYNYTTAPYMVDKNAVMQGFVSNEPYQIEKAGVKPHVILLADQGYANYSCVIQTTDAEIAKHADVVQAFIEASIEGWQNYLNGDPEPGNKLIMAANKDMTPDLLANSIKVMKQYGIVQSGDALTLGIGAMTDARWKSFYDGMAQAGLYPTGMDYRKAFTLQFVDKKYDLSK